MMKELHENSEDAVERLHFMMGPDAITAGMNLHSVFPYSEQCLRAHSMQS